MSEVDDPLLPAAPYLTGPGAREAVEAAVAVTGGVVRSLSIREVIYRPRRMLVVRYDVEVGWAERADVSETILAATTVDGAPAGTLVMEAEDPPLQIGVWRYPFDPELPGLAAAVTPRRAGALLGCDPHALSLRVRSFRACRRAVVHARWAGGEAYVKVVPPAATAPLVERHAAMGAAALPIPDVVAVAADEGLVALSPLPGNDLRSHLLSVDAPLPLPAAVVEMVRALAEVSLELPSGEAGEATSLLVAASRHAAMLRRVHPGAGSALDVLLGLLRVDDPGRRWPGTVHGDLYDAQLRVDATGALVGLLDIDGTGPGDVVDDLGRMVAHLHALAATSSRRAKRITAYADECRAEFGHFVAPEELDRRIAAALVGLATGPFRRQQTKWPSDVDHLLALATRFALDAASPG